MQVKDRMTSDPIVVIDTAPFEDALRLMRDKKVRRLPVVNKDGRLVGIVAERDLLYASPAPTASLSVFEVHYQLAKMTVQQVMAKRVITVGEDCPLEEAARIMVDHKIGSLPVVTGGKLVGIITETDIFRTFLEILGGREPGLRLTLDVTEGKGVLAGIAGEIARAGGNILSVASFQAPDADQRIVYVKVTGAAKEDLLNGLEAAGARVLDAQEVAPGGYAPTILDGRQKPSAGA
jgi:acetoin utilization protein AcuB